MKRTARWEFDDRYVADVGEDKCAIFYKDTGKRVVKDFALPFDSIFAHIGGGGKYCTDEFESED